MVNAIIMFITFLATIPALLMPTSRMWLKLHGYLVFICAMVSMVIGLVLWFDTLKTRSNLSTVWASQTQEVQSLLQQKVRIKILEASRPINILTAGLVAVLWLLEQQLAAILPGQRLHEPAGCGAAFGLCWTVQHAGE